MPPDIETVNQVQSDGRIRLPPPLREAYAGEFMAIYELENEEKIVLEKVEADD